MPDLPSGTVTFLFTDIEGSTVLWERDQVVMATAVARHLTLLRAAIVRHGGALFKVIGDAVQAAFPTAPDAVAAALEAQRAFVQEGWPEGIGPLQVRMALHTAAANPQDSDYLAPGLNRLARLLAAAHGGQILLSLATQDLSRDTLPLGASLRDLGEHPLRDLYRPERVFQLLHPDIPPEFPVLRTLATRPNNLPLQPTPFLGREDQVARVIDLLSRADVRLLTITGPGGVGKTRLALQAGADLLNAFPDGVWFVDLSALDEPALVPPAIAAVLGVREEGGNLVQQLAATVGSKHLLLILDNFERVLDAVEAVSDLLANVAGLKVLITSRTPLHAYGEREYLLAPLPLPDPSHLSSLEQVSRYEGVRLFVERAQAVKPDFDLADDNAPAVAQICSRLDGLPLAIELAAALVKVLPPQSLLKRLERRLPLLTGGARTLPLRQQTMRNTIAWSHELLSPEEQTLLRRLAVFPGGCTFEAAEAVANPEGMLETFHGIASLVDKSLLRQEEGPEGEPRFRMLEMVREYGLERLEASGETDATRQRHADWCLSLAEQVQPDHFAESMSPEEVACFDTELPNLRAAVTWFLERGNGRSALRLLAASEDYWTQRQPHSVDLHRWLEAALAMVPEAPAADRALAHLLLASGYADRGDAVQALRNAERMQMAARESAEPTALALAYVAMGEALDAQGDVAQSAAAYAEALTLLRGLKESAGSAGWFWYAQAAYADSLVLRGLMAQGVPLLQEALDRMRQADADWVIVLLLNRRAHAALIEGDLGLAASLFAEAIDAGRRFRVTRAVLSAVTGLAGVALRRGQAERAARMLGAVENARETFGVWNSAGWVHARRIAEEIRAALGGQRFQQAEAEGRASTLDKAVADALAIADEVDLVASG